MSKGSILYDDILQSLTLSGREMSAQDLNAHAALLYEAVLAPVVNSKNQMTLQMKSEVIANDQAFIKSLLYVMYSRTGGAEFPLVEEFKAEAIAFLKSNPNALSSQAHAAFPVAPSLAAVDAAFNESFGGQAGFNNFNNPAGFKPPRGAVGSMDPNAAKRNPQRMITDPGEMIGMDPAQMSLQQRIEFEKSEPIVRLLAQVRKVGMDILFPQSVHDKVIRS
jgi:hypothetical protein